MTCAWAAVLGLAVVAAQPPADAAKVKELIAQGNAHAEKRDLAKAVAAYSSALALDPKNAEARTRRGDAYFLTGELAKAVADYTAVLDADSKLVEPRVNRGNAYFLSGEIDRAAADYTAALEQAPKLAVALRARARCRRAKGDYPKALADLNTAIDADPKNPEWRAARADLHYARQDYAAALADWSAAIELDPRLGQNFLGRAQALHAQAKFAEAVADCTKALELSPDQAPAALQARGAARKEAGDLDAAIADFTEVLKHDPKDTYALVARGHAWLAKKSEANAAADYAAAARLDTEALRAAPRDAAAYNRLAWLLATCDLAKLRDGKRALGLAGQACELTGYREANYLDTLAAAHAELGQFAEAVKRAKEALAVPDGLGGRERAEVEARLKLFEMGTAFREK
jgi:tetratricopeptide (TPR) repeat protein